MGNSRQRLLLLTGVSSPRYFVIRSDKSRLCVLDIPYISRSDRLQMSRSAIVSDEAVVARTNQADLLALHVGSECSRAGLPSRPFSLTFHRVRLLLLCEQVYGKLEANCVDLALGFPCAYDKS